MIGWFLRAIREFKCEHEWKEIRRTATYGRLTRHGEIESTTQPTKVKTYFFCSKCGGKRVV